MPTVTAERLMDIANALLQAAGASAEEAATIARYNIGANLVGHDSPRHHPDPDLYRSHQGRPHRAGRAMGHHPGDRHHAP